MTAQSSARESARGKRILVVDDDEGVRELLREVLLEAGYQVTVASQGREMLAELRHEHFDLVITDILMPEQDGLESIGMLRHEFPRQRVVALSGAAGVLLEVASRMGASQVLTKPVRPVLLLETVAQVVSS